MAENFSINDFTEYLNQYDKTLAAQEAAHQRYLRTMTYDNKQAWEDIYEYTKKSIDNTTEARKAADRIYEKYHENSVSRMNAKEYEAYRTQQRKKLEEDSEYLKDKMNMLIA